MQPISVGPFDLIEPIGRGGTGVVWRGMHRDARLPVAVKVLTEYAPRAAHAARDFRNEVRAVAALDHPGIVRIFDAGHLNEAAENTSGGKFQAGRPYLAMEYAGGGTLKDFSPAGWEEVRSVLTQLLDALGHAHARGIVHRDLKPSNVLRSLHTDARPGWKLTDFGIATVLEQTVERSIAHELVGTLAFMAPEQIKGEWRDYGPWTDLYALGCLVYRVVGDQRVFGLIRGPGLITAHLLNPPDPLVPRMPVPSGLADWAARLLAKTPRDRFQSAAEATRALATLGPPVVSETSDLMPQPLLVARVVDEDTTIELEGPTEVVHGGSNRAPGLVPDDWRLSEPRIPPPSELVAGLSLVGIRTTPLVGRLTERDRLWEVLKRVVGRGRAEVVVLRGPQGVGTSRLARWLGETAHARSGASFLWGDARPDELPHEALARPFRRALHTERLDAAKRREQLKARLLIDDDDETLLQTAVTFLASREEAAGTWLGAEARHTTARQLLERFSVPTRGVVLWLDDAALAPDLLRFALHLLDAQQVRPVPVLTILTVTEPAGGVEGEIEALEAALGTTAMTIGHLSRAEQEKVIEGIAPLESTVVAALAERTVGNPLHAVQIVRSWVIADALTAGPGGLSLKAAMVDVAPLPELWRARLRRLFDGLPAVARGFLERAATLGVQVDPGDWQLVCDDPTAEFARLSRVHFVPQHAALRETLLQRLLDEELVEENDEGFRFLHGQFRETLLTLAASAGRLRAHHAACAALLQVRAQLKPAANSPQAERLGRHLLGAGQPELAVIPLVEGFRHRVRTAGDRQALPLLGEIEGALQVAGVAANDIRWAELAARRAEVLFRLGRLRDARRWGAEAERRARSGRWKVLRARGALTVGRVRLLQGDHLEADAALARSESLLSADEEPRLLGTVHAARAECATALNDEPAARKHAEAAAKYLREAGERRGLAEAWVVVGTQALRDGAHIEAGRSFERARQLQLRMGSPVDVARTTQWLAEVAWATGDLEEARKRFTEAARGYRSAGSLGVVQAYLGLARIELARRDWAEAQRLGAVLLADIDGRDDIAGEVGVRAVLAAAAAGSRDWSSFDTHVQRIAARLRVSVPRDPDGGFCLRLAAARAEATGDPIRAALALEQARLLDPGGS